MTPHSARGQHVSVRHMKTNWFLAFAAATAIFVLVGNVYFLGGSSQHAQEFAPLNSANAAHIRRTETLGERAQNQHNHEKHSVVSQNSQQATQSEKKYDSSLSSLSQGPEVDFTVTDETPSAILKNLHQQLSSGVNVRKEDLLNALKAAVSRLQEVAPELAPTTSSNEHSSQDPSDDKTDDTTTENISYAQTLHEVPLELRETVQTCYVQRDESEMCRYSNLCFDGQKLVALVDDAKTRNERDSGKWKTSTVTESTYSDCFDFRYYEGSSWEYTQCIYGQQANRNLSIPFEARAPEIDHPLLFGARTWGPHGGQFRWRTAHPDIVFGKPKDALHDAPDTSYSVHCAAPMRDSPTTWTPNKTAVSSLTDADRGAIIATEALSCLSDPLHVPKSGSRHDSSRELTDFNQAQGFDNRHPFVKSKNERLDVYDSVNSVAHGKATKQSVSHARSLAGLRNSPVHDDYPHRNDQLPSNPAASDADSRNDENAGTTDPRVPETLNTGMTESSNTNPSQSNTRPFTDRTTSSALEEDKPQNDVNVDKSLPHSDNSNRDSTNQEAHIGSNKQDNQMPNRAGLNHEDFHSKDESPIELTSLSDAKSSSTTGSKEDTNGLPTSAQSHGSSNTLTPKDIDDVPTSAQLQALSNTLTQEQTNDLPTSTQSHASSNTLTEKGADQVPNEKSKSPIEIEWFDGHMWWMYIDAGWTTNIFHWSSKAMVLFDALRSNRTITGNVPPNPYHVKYQDDSLVWVSRKRRDGIANIADSDRFAQPLGAETQSDLPFRYSQTEQANAEASAMHDILAETGPCQSNSKRTLRSQSRSLVDTTSQETSSKTSQASEEQTQIRSRFMTKRVVQYAAEHTLSKAYRKNSFYGQMVMGTQWDLPPMDYVVLNGPGVGSKKKPVPNADKLPRWAKGSLKIVTQPTTRVAVNTDLSRYNSSRWLCFKDAMVVGSKHKLVTGIVDAWMFRHYAYQLAGATTMSHSHHPPRLITFIDRGGARTLLNGAEFRKELYRPGLPVQIVRNIGSMSFEEQVKLMSETGILIAAHGAGLTNAMFLPQHAAVIELNPYKMRKTTYSNIAGMFGLFYRAVDTNEKQPFDKRFNDTKHNLLYQDTFTHNCELVNRSTIDMLLLYQCNMPSKNSMIKVPITEFRATLETVVDLIAGFSIDRESWRNANWNEFKKIDKVMGVPRNKQMSYEPAKEWKHDAACRYQEKQARKKRT